VSTQKLVAVLFALLTVGMGNIITANLTAHADVDGSVPSTGSCPYPAVGTFGAAFGEYDYACQFPLEENGSRHTTLFGGGMWQVSGTIGISFMIFNASVSATSPAGVLRGISYFACPDFSFAEAPNPPGAWKNLLKPKPCKSIGARPELIRDMPTPPPGLPTPPPPPQPEIAPPPPSGDTPNAATGAVTDPGQGNPDATVDNPH
jgi:hypothetical protein